MRVFVTGPNGFIGSVVVKKLIDNGYDVCCLLRKTSDTKRIDSLKYDTVFGDVRDYDSLLDGMKNCGAVIHLASLSNWNDINSPLMDDVVIKGSKNVFEAAKVSGNLKTIFVSTIAAINGTLSPKIQNEESDFELNLAKFAYSRAKCQVEKMGLKAHEEGLPVVIVNPAEVYGPHDTALNTAANLIDFANSSPVLTCNGGTSVVYVDDVAKGIVSCIKNGVLGQRYILGGDNLTVTELAKLTLKILGQENKKVIQLPNWILQSAGKVAQTLRLPFPVNPLVIPYATKFWFMDNTKAKNELGISFRSASDTLVPTIKWLQQEKLL
ncbi:NAD-dependent epimerase/dehydratase family protein [Sulfobacillus acidophilus]|uniref:NAD-dependent epimerase/dehydratase family protein n=1 Tax=Sulfobacillus acidophilus TaxID=53633 RepID=A0ABS3AW78_9FIRM|nr:NAD-dependent epimerase/dehydratase family protein [Sulfobacillus acidophilus]